MADPTMSPLTAQIGYDIMQDLFFSLQDNQQKTKFNFMPRYIWISFIYPQIIAGGAGDLEQVFIDTRKFFKNTSGSTVQVEGNGITWDLLPGVIYCCANEELAFFLGKAAELSLPLAVDTYANWLASVTPAQSYFWS